MKDVSDITVCVIDRGTFFPVAERMARDCHKVYYHKPNGEDFPTFAQSMRGDGNPGVHMLKHYWPIKHEIDLFMFPDCRDADLQWELAGQGFPVWGGRYAIDQENKRGAWLDTCEAIGLPMPDTNDRDWET